MERGRVSGGRGLVKTIDKRLPAALQRILLILSPGLAWRIFETAMVGAGSLLSAFVLRELQRTRRRPADRFSG